MANVGWQALLVIAGALLGFGLSPFATSHSVPAAAAAGVLVLAIYVARALFWNRLAVLCGLVAFVAAYAACSRFVRDRPPQLAYSLKRLSQEQAAAFKQKIPGTGDYYQFEVRNDDSAADIVGLDIALDLPNYLVASPLLVDQIRADGARTLPGYVLAIRTIPDHEPESIPFLSNSATIAAERLHPGGSLDVVVLTQSGGQPVEQDSYGVLSVVQSHLHYGELVSMRQAFPIARMGVDKELLDTSITLQPDARSVHGPVMGVQAEAPGTRWFYQMHGH